MVKIVSDSLKSATEEQIGKERYNASVYLYSSSYFNNNGCPNIAKFFRKQHDEEISHSLMFADLLDDLGVFFDIVPIDGCNMPYKDWKYVGELFLNAEIETTKSLIALRDMAHDEGCGIIEEKIREMIGIQQSELRESTDFYDKMQNMPDWSHVILLDASFGD
jgi:ferritin